MQQLFDKRTQSTAVVGRLQNDQNETIDFEKLALQYEK